MIDLIALQPKLSPHNIQKMVFITDIYIISSHCAIKYLNTNKETQLAPQLYVN